MVNTIMNNNNNKNLLKKKCFKLLWFWMIIQLFYFCIINNKYNNKWCWAVDGKQIFLEQEIVENLVREWAPLVWLAPNEKFMPGNVNDFMNYVHAEKGSQTSLPIKIPPILSNQNNELLDFDEDFLYYDTSAADVAAAFTGGTTSSTAAGTGSNLVNSPNNVPSYEFGNDINMPIVPRVGMATDITSHHFDSIPLLLGTESSTLPPFSQWPTTINKFRKNRMFGDYSTSDVKEQIPLGKRSLNWYLVTNNKIDDLLNDQSSFIYGRNPNTANIPIYAMVNMCSGGSNSNNRNPDVYLNNEITSKLKNRMDHQSSYIPIQSMTSTDDDLNIQPPKFPYIFEDPLKNHDSSSSKITSNQPEDNNDIESYSELFRDRLRRDTQTLATDQSKLSSISSTTTITPTKTITSTTTSTTKLTTTPTPTPTPKLNSPALNRRNISWQSKRNIKIENKSSKNINRLPHFHVTYWMFYPYSQGKTICTVNLGPLGHLPIPSLFGICIGTKRDFGSHVGDWEHMSLYFKGNKEPEEMYVSAHDAGAYYSYERLTGTFDFRRQETRKGILQQPNFPKTVRTTNGGNHPILFSAQGSHGLWTAPGKHRFVRVPRLFDINGFGVPWSTWKQIEFSYDGDFMIKSQHRQQQQQQQQRPRRQNQHQIMLAGPEWLRFMGRWGNPKSKCHPLKKIGLNFCEYTDGPTGIPLKEPHFYCSR